MAYNILRKEAASVVYVLNKDGKPLMPTNRCGHVRKLLKSGKAIVVKRKPFTIKLTYDTPDCVQPISLGVDTGYTHVGGSAVTDTHVADPKLARFLNDNTKQIQMSQSRYNIVGR